MGLRVFLAVIGLVAAFGPGLFGAGRGVRRGAFGGQIEKSGYMDAEGWKERGFPDMVLTVYAYS